MNEHEKLNYVERPARDLPATRASIEQAGGRIEKAVFDFPGGRRFHFSEPSGNEFAVWSAQAAVQADRQE